MSGSFESVRWNACAHSHPKEFFFFFFGGGEGDGSEPMLTPREKSPLPEKFFREEDRTHDAASSRTASPTLYQRAVPGPEISHNPWKTIFLVFAKVRRGKTRKHIHHLRLSNTQRA